MKKIFTTQRLLPLLFFLTTAQFLTAQHSVARQWNDVLLEAIRSDFARPTVHARNLFHTSIALYDAWAVYDTTGAETFLLGKNVRGYDCPFNGVAMPADIEAAREEAMSYAAYRLLQSRFANTPGGNTTLNNFTALFTSLGYNPNYYSTNYSLNNPAALGNYLANQIVLFGNQDGANEQNDYENIFYSPINPPLVTDLPGNPDLEDPNRWQPLTLDVFIDQSGNVFPFNTPDFLSPEWGAVVPFALSDEDLTLHQRNGDVYWTYHDPGTPPQIDTTLAGGIADEYKWGFLLVSAWSSHLDPTSPFDTMIDISPASIGNIQVADYPTDIAGLRNFYNLQEGGDISPGHTTNPVTNAPYTPQMVSRADYGRVLAEFWADGPDSETPPGHWFTILNYVNDHPLLEKRFRGQGPILGDLEWDVKAYFALGGAVHDAAISAWGAKGWYDYLRPISAIRSMAERGQSTYPSQSSYHPGGLPLLEGFSALVDSTDALAGFSYENVGKIKVMAWRGPDFINNPAVDFAGVDWILAENWWPYQRPSFVTPPFAGYVSGHSTFSRAAAEVLTMLTGDPFFPGGMGEFDMPMNDFLVFENGPSMDITLQWATYRDASDQCSLSRIWGGIHPPADDIPGRLMGIEIGTDAFNYAETYFFVDADNDGYFDFEDCDDNNAAINPGAAELCNGLDENCNNLIDDNTTIYSYYLDADNDGFGDLNTPLDTCQNFAPTGYVDNSSDCDDTNDAIHPNAMEVCDGIDNNCNQSIDDGLTLFTYYLDSDGDTYGDANNPLDTCQSVAPAGYATNANDCDDSNSNINPAAIEVCDGFDNNCSQQIDDGLPIFTYYLDADNDTFGDNNNPLSLCQTFAPMGYVSNNQDCDDTNDAIHPNAPETCDGIDNNCNNMADDGLPIFTYYMDSDNDTFGSPLDSIETCEGAPPMGYVLNNQDCDDFNNTINPNGVEIINNGIDEDCIDGDFMVGVEDNTFDEKIELFPNPFSDNLTIRSEYQGELIVQILSGDGQLVSKNIVQLNGGVETLNFNQVAAGIYFVVISNTEGTQRHFEKVIKQ